MTKYILPVFFISLFFCKNLSAQDTLPNFSVNNIGNNRIVVSWANNYGLVKQINVQRSYDSLKNYTTILNVADPMNKVNGFADAKAPSGNMFYRLFVVLDKGAFYFTTPKKPVIDSTRRPDISRIHKMNIIDSLNVPANPGVSGIPRPDLYIPSTRVFTQRNGYIRINLPDAAQKKYNIKFYAENENFLFELKDIKQTFFTLEKANFYHAGWFKFEIFDNETLVEKNKFFIPKDF